MTVWLHRAGRILAQLAAAAVILLALLVGVARLLLPEAPRFADDVRRIAEEATGFKVDFALLSAGVSLYGPELRLANVTLDWPDGQPIASADSIAVALDVPTFLSSGAVRPAKIFVDSTNVSVDIAADGEILLQGRPWQDYLPAEQSADTIPEIRVELRNIGVNFTDQQRAVEAVEAVVKRLSANVEAGQVELQADIEPGETLGRRLELDGRVPLELLRKLRDYDGADIWRLRVRASDFRLDPWLRLVALADAPIIGSRGTAEAALEFVGRQAVSAMADLDIEAVELAQAGAENVLYDSISGKLNWQRTGGGWVMTGENLLIARGGQAWPPDDFTVRWRDLADEQTGIEARIDFLRAEDLMPLVAAFAGDSLRDAGLTGSPSGDFWNFRGSAILAAETAAKFSVEGEFKNLGYTDGNSGLIVGGLNGSVAASEDGGRLQLATAGARIGIAALFREVLEVSNFSGLAVWRANASGYRVIANDLQIETPDGRGSASLELQTDADFANPVVDLTAQASMEDTDEAIKYLPKKIPEPVVNWLKDALQGGRATAAEFRLQGPLTQFPFRDDEGEFRIAVQFENGGLSYVPGWPAIQNASGELVFLNESLYSERNSFKIGDIQIDDARVQIADFKKGVLTVSGGGPVELQSLLSFLQNSPLAEKLGSVFADVRVSGQGDGVAELVLPVRDIDAWSLEGEVVTRDGSAWLTTLEPRFTGLAGTVRFQNLWVSSPQLSGRLMDEPVLISIEPDQAPQATSSHRVQVSGAMPYSKAERALGLPQIGKLSGRTDFIAEALFPAFGPKAEPFRLELSSSLVGVKSALPYPLNKASERVDQLGAVVRFPERNRIAVDLELQRGLLARLELARDESSWVLQPSAVGLNVPPPVYAGANGIVLGGAVDRVDLAEWVTAFAPSAGDAARASESTEPWQRWFDRIDLDISELYAVGHRFPDVELGAAFGNSAWDIDLRGPFVAGAVTVPYDFAEDAFIELELDRLMLVEPASVDAGSDDDPLSPLELTGIRGTVGDFVLRELRLGALETEIMRTPRGLEIAALTTRAPSFGIAATGDWLVIDSAQRSRLRLEIRSSDMGQTLAQLGYSPLIEAESGTLVADLLWEGGPGEAALYASTGAVEFTIRDGEVNDLDPGGGRLLGLLSITSLPRRLALDFSDMTEEGLTFDTIRGRFRMDFGNAWTCNLSLEGEIADMAIVGRTGLVAEDYDQLAVVRPHVSNLIPVSAAFLGGPTLGVATLLVAQIFKKPLSGIGESYYTVAGDWANPDIRKTQRSNLDTQSFADCESQLPVLSPEEIAAIEDLISGKRSESAPVPEAQQPAPATLPTEDTPVAP